MASHRRLFALSCSVQKKAPANKFSNQRSLRHRICRDRKEIAQKLQQAFGLLVFRAVLGEIVEQQRLHIGLEQGDLIEQGRIEDRIGAVLKRKNILLLAPPDRRPHLDRGLGARSRGSWHPARCAATDARRW